MPDFTTTLFPPVSLSKKFCLLSVSPVDPMEGVLCLFTHPMTYRAVFIIRGSVLDATKCMTLISVTNNRRWYEIRSLFSDGL